jgi:glycosyltransferase involved in cell wall biosynthesis
MRILFTSNHGNTFNPKGGTDARKHNLIKELAKYNEIVVLEPDRYIDDRYKKFPEISVDYYKEFFFFNRPLSPFTDINPSFIYKIYRIISSEKIDLIQVSYPAGIVVTKSLIKIMRKNIVLVYDAHDVVGDLIKSIFLGDYNIFVKCLLYLYVPILERIGVHVVDHVIAVSSNDKNIFLKKYGIDSNKISVIPSGTTIRDLPNNDIKAIAKNKLGIKKGKKVVLFHGTYSYPPNKQAVN